MHMGYSPRYDHMVSHKTSLNKLKKIEIKVFFYPTQSAMKLEIGQGKLGNLQIYWN